MKCSHDFSERESSVATEGYCPICMAAEIERLRAALRPFAQFAEHTGGPSALIHEEWDVTVADAIRARDLLADEQSTPGERK
jgi:hypothetical protein